MKGRSRYNTDDEVEEEDRHGMAGRRMTTRKLLIMKEDGDSDEYEPWIAVVLMPPSPASHPLHPPPPPPLFCLRSLSTTRMTQIFATTSVATEPSTEWCWSLYGRRWWCRLNGRISEDVNYFVQISRWTWWGGWQGRLTITVRMVMLEASTSVASILLLYYYWSLLYSAVLRSRADSLRSHVILHEGIAF